MTTKWLWPSSDEVNDFPDPLGFEEEWRPWDGTMAEGPSRFAEIFCREHLQNSWDSIQDRIKDIPDPVDYGVTYRFVDLAGPEATAFAEQFGLTEHATRVRGMNKKDRASQRLDETAVASGEFDHVRLLIASEFYGAGMSGPWHTEGKAGVVSRLKSALIQTRSAKDSDASGGSWGHGKKAIANASKCRTIAVYSAWRPIEGDPNEEGGQVTRRFLGTSYWRSHDLGDRSHVGLGLLGVQKPGSGYFGFRPLQDDEADDYVAKLGIPELSVRSGDGEETGTTYVIVEPAFTPEDLARAIERNWWPLLNKHRGAVRVIGPDGADITIDADEQPPLRPFIQAAKLIEEPKLVRQRGDRLATLTSDKTEDGSVIEVGQLALTSDDSETGWSYESPETNWSLVALVRNDMVIEYARVPRRRRVKAPFVRGVLIVDRDVNDHASEVLKMSEPHLHNVWNVESSPSVPRYAARLASDVMKKVQGQVSELKNSLREDNATAFHQFPEFSRLFSSPSGRPTPRRPTVARASRDFSITYGELSREVHPSEFGLIRMTARVEISLSSKASKLNENLPSVVKLGWGVLEEAGATKEKSLRNDATIVGPPGFDIERSKLVGLIGAEALWFSWTSDYFPDDWQVVPYPEVEAEAQSEESA